MVRNFKIFIYFSKITKKILYVYLMELDLEKLEDIKELEQEIIELNELFNEFNQYVQQQSEPINKINDYIDKSEKDVNKGVEELKKANNYSISHRLFVAGSIIGGVVTGVTTFGFGLGIWSISTIGGSIVGGIIGKSFNK